LDIHREKITSEKYVGSPVKKLIYKKIKDKNTKNKGAFGPLCFPVLTGLYL
jgi:hypothetical protein